MYIIKANNPNEVIIETLYVKILVVCSVSTNGEPASLANLEESWTT